MGHGTVTFQQLYGKKAAALYTQAGDYQKTARFYYKKAEDTYYQANNWASYDDWPAPATSGTTSTPATGKRLAAICCRDSERTRTFLICLWGGFAVTVSGQGRCVPEINL